MGMTRFKVTGGLNMFRILLTAVAAVLIANGSARAFGVDVGPVHVHGTKVKVGSTIELRIEIDKITKDEDKEDRVKRLKAHRKGDSDDEFLIKVSYADLDDDSKDLLKKVKTDTIYKVRLEKADDDWKLLKIRKDD